MRAADSRPMDPTDPVVQMDLAIADVAQAAALLERMTAVITYGLIGVDTITGRAVVDNMSRMIDVIRRLAPIKIADDLRTELLAWAREAKDAYDQRSAVIRSAWTPMSETPSGRPTAFVRVSLKHLVPDDGWDDRTPLQVFEVAQRIYRALPNDLLPKLPSVPIDERKEH